MTKYELEREAHEIIGLIPLSTHEQSIQAIVDLAERYAAELTKADVERMEKATALIRELVK